MIQNLKSKSSTLINTSGFFSIVYIFKSLKQSQVQIFLVNIPTSWPLCWFHYFGVDFYQIQWRKLKGCPLLLSLLDIQANNFMISPEFSFHSSLLLIFITFGMNLSMGTISTSNKHSSQHRQDNLNSIPASQPKNKLNSQNMGPRH